MTANSRASCAPANLVWRAARLALPVVMGLVGCQSHWLHTAEPAPSPAAARPVATANPAPGANGAIASLELIIRSAHSE